MKDTNKKAFGGFLFLLAAMAALLFCPAGTLDYWQAWVFLAVFFVPSLAITIYLMKKDPKLLERRTNAGPRAEKEKGQKIIQFFAQAAFTSAIVFPALDHRFAWSAVPRYAVAAGDILIALGFLGVFFVFRENTFTSATIEIATDQKVISSGPYAVVRHPMYVCSLVMFSGVPLALGSFWSLFAIIPMVLVIISRLIDEEKFLVRNLPGYTEYQKKVKYRLLPYIW